MTDVEGAAHPESGTGGPPRKVVTVGSIVPGGSLYSGENHGCSADWPEMDWYAPGETGVLMWALAYARLGYPVMPGRPMMNVPALPKGFTYDENGPGTRDEVVIRRWYAPLYGGDVLRNVGLQAGRGFIVIDVDTHPGKPNGFESLSEAGLVLPDAPSERTPNGRHLFMRLPEGETQKVHNGWLPGVEIKGMGCFVAVWPSARSYASTSIKDKDDYLPISYQREEGWPCAIDELPEIPGWLLEDIRGRPPVRMTKCGGTAVETRDDDRLPPTEKFLESGLGWFTGSRTNDCFKLLWRLFNKYEDTWRVAQEALRMYEATSDVDGFPWEKVVVHIRRVEEKWSEQRETWERWSR